MQTVKCIVVSKHSFSSLCSKDEEACMLQCLSLFYIHFLHLTSEPLFFLATLSSSSPLHIPIIFSVPIFLWYVDLDY